MEDEDEEAEGREAPDGAGEEVEEAGATDAVDGQAAALDAGDDEAGEDKAAKLEDVGHEDVEGADVGDGVRRGDLGGVGIGASWIIAGSLPAMPSAATVKKPAKTKKQGDEDEGAPSGAEAEAAVEDGGWLTLEEWGRGRVEAGGRGVESGWAKVMGGSGN